MTFVLALATADAIWPSTDRRLVWGQSSPRFPPDTAVKFADITTQKERALIGYAGVGSVGDTEISAWIERTITGVAGNVEAILLHLAVIAATRIEPFARRAGQDHVFVIPALRVDTHSIYGIGPELDNAVPRRFHTHRYDARSRTWPLLAMAGSGATVIGPRQREKVVELRRLAGRYLQRKIGPDVIAEKMATINAFVSSRVLSRDVSNECVVTWRHRDGSGWHKCYSHGKYDKTGQVDLRGLMGNMPICAFVKNFMNAVRPAEEVWAAVDRGESPNLCDEDALKVMAARLPTKSNDSLP